MMALVFAMGGTGYALTIPRNSVGTPQIKRGGVANSDIRTNAVTSSKVKNGSLLARDFAFAQLPARPCRRHRCHGRDGPDRTAGSPRCGGRDHGAA